MGERHQRGLVADRDGHLVPRDLADDGAVAPRLEERAQQAGVLLVGGHDLVALAEPQSRDHAPEPVVAEVVSAICSGGAPTTRP